MSTFKNTVKAIISDIDTKFGSDSEDITLNFTGSGINEYSVQSYYATSGLNPVIDLGYEKSLFDPVNSGVSIKGGYSNKFDAVYSGLYVTGTITSPAAYSGLSNSDVGLATATGFTDPLTTGLMFTSGINSVLYLGYSEPFDAIIYENQTGSNACALNLYYSTATTTGVNNYNPLYTVSGGHSSGLVYDGTDNMTRDGHLMIKAPSDWVKTAYPYNGSGYFEASASTAYYYLRIHKTNSGVGNHGRIVGTAAPISYVRIDAGANPFILNLTKDLVNEGFVNSYDLKANYFFLTNGHYTDLRLTVSGGSTSSRVNVTTGL